MFVAVVAHQSDQLETEIDNKKMSILISFLFFLFYKRPFAYFRGDWGRNRSKIARSNSIIKWKRKSGITSKATVNSAEHVAFFFLFSFFPP